jgi:hypothetical protein
VTVVAVNKDLHGAGELRLDVGSLNGKLRVWRFDQQTGEKITVVADQAGAVDGTIRVTLPAASATVLVVASKD